MKEWFLSLLEFVVNASIGALLYCIITVDTPTALDVYRGKTTLEITYRDSVAIDSVVVYKKLDYGK